MCIRDSRPLGAPGDGPYDRKTGKGYLPAIRGDYAAALGRGVRVHVLLFETFGGFGAEVRSLLHDAAAVVNNKLSPTQYEETTWGARSWHSFQRQRISVRLHTAVAWQIANELRPAAAAAAAGDAAT